MIGPILERIVTFPVSVRIAAALGGGGTAGASTGIAPMLVPSGRFRGCVRSPRSRPPGGPATGRRRSGDEIARKLHRDPDLAIRLGQDRSAKLAGEGLDKPAAHMPRVEIPHIARPVIHHDQFKPAR